MSFVKILIYLNIHRPYKAVAGDVLLLTKPIGAQIACNIHRWCESNDSRYNKVSDILSRDDVEVVYKHAVLSMARLNRTAAKLMHKYDAHAATDVTGFGVIGHASNLVETQENPVKFIIHSLPVISKIAQVAQALGNVNFLKGTTPETSGKLNFSIIINYTSEFIVLLSGGVVTGGMLVALSRENAVAFCTDIHKHDRWPCWIIGEVAKGDRTVEMVDTPMIINAEYDTFID